MTLYFCPRCRHPAMEADMCPACAIPCDDGPESYVEKLMAALFLPDPTRVGMAVDAGRGSPACRPRNIKILTPLIHLARTTQDVECLWLAAQGLGHLGDAAAVPILIELLRDTDRPYIARAAAARSLGQLGGDQAIAALKQACSDPCPSVAQSAATALQKLGYS